MKRKLSELILLNYQDLISDGLGSQLKHSRKMFLRGGRFSGKSFFAAHHIVLSLLELAYTHKEGEPWACCLALRKYSNTLKTSVYAEITNAIINLGVEDKFQMLTNPMEIRLKGTKSVIKFANLNTSEDYGKVKSIKFPGGYCRFVWFEERRSVSKQTETLIKSYYLYIVEETYLKLYSHITRRSVRVIGLI